MMKQYTSKLEDSIIQKDEDKINIKREKMRDYSTICVGILLLLGIALTDPIHILFTPIYLVFGYAGILLISIGWSKNE